jgi:hypothetical protein
MIGASIVKLARLRQAEEFLGTALDRSAADPSLDPFSSLDAFSRTGGEMQLNTLPESALPPGSERHALRAVPIWLLLL